MPGKGALRAGFVRPQHDVVAHAVGRVQAHHRMRLQPAAIDQALEHAFAITEHTLGLCAHHLVFQNSGKGASQIPSLEKRAPVDKRL